MPHVFTARSRQFGLVRGGFPPPQSTTAGEEALVEQEKKNPRNIFWECFNTGTYFIGGYMFVAGSILFLPAYEEHVAIGSWIFVVASILYIVVSLHDLMEMIYFREEESVMHLPTAHLKRSISPVDFLAAFVYLLGASIFTVGSLLFLPSVGQYHPGAWCFIIGSLFFVVGALCNAWQIFEAQTAGQARYMLSVALCYTVGSVIFVLASIPYLFEFVSQKDETRIYQFLAGQYILGSIFFAIGGTINWINVRPWTKKNED